MDYAGSPDVWLPARFNAASPPTGSFGWSAIGRLKEGVRPDQAATHLEPLVQPGDERVHPERQLSRVSHTTAATVPWCTR